MTYVFTDSMKIPEIAYWQTCLQPTKIVLPEFGNASRSSCALPKLHFAFPKQET